MSEPETGSFVEDDPLRRYAGDREFIFDASRREAELRQMCDRLVDERIKNPNSISALLVRNREEERFANNHIRDSLKRQGHIGKEDHRLSVFENNHWSDAQKVSGNNYRKGHVLHFNENVPGHIKGDKLEVQSVTKDGYLKVSPLDRQFRKNEPSLVSLKDAHKWDVGERQYKSFSRGEQVQITGNVSSREFIAHDIQDRDHNHSKNTFRRLNSVSKSEADFGRGKLSIGYSQMDHGYAINPKRLEGAKVDKLYVSDDRLLKDSKTKQAVERSSKHVVNEKQAKERAPQGLKSRSKPKSSSRPEIAKFNGKTYMRTDQTKRMAQSRKLHKAKESVKSKQEKTPSLQKAQRSNKPADKKRALQRPTKSATATQKPKEKEAKKSTSKPNRLKQPTKVESKQKPPSKNESKHRGQAGKTQPKKRSLTKAKAAKKKEIGKSKNTSEKKRGMKQPGKKVAGKKRDMNKKAASKNRSSKNPQKAAQKNPKKSVIPQQAKKAPTNTKASGKGQVMAKKSVGRAMDRRSARNLATKQGGSNGKGVSRGISAGKSSGGGGRSRGKSK